FLGTDLCSPGLGLFPDERLADALRDGFDLDRRFNLPLLSLLNVKYLFSDYPLRGTGLVLVHAPERLGLPAGPRDYATGLAVATGVAPARFSLAGLRQATDDFRQALRRRRRGKDVYVYRNTNVLPRYRFVTAVEALDSDRAVLDRLSALTAEELGRVA